MQIQNSKVSMCGIIFFLEETSWDFIINDIKLIYNSFLTKLCQNVLFIQFYFQYSMFHSSNVSEDYKYLSRFVTARFATVTAGWHSRIIHSRRDRISSKSLHYGQFALIASKCLETQLKATLRHYIFSFGDRNFTIL